MIDDQADGMRNFFPRLWLDLEGWVCIAHGIPYLDDGKVRHRCRDEHSFSYPRQLDSLIDCLVEMSATRDTWFTPGLSFNPFRKLTRRKCLPSWCLWCDLDGAGPDDQDRARHLSANGGCLVSSGRGPGHWHAYLRLAKPVAGDLVEEWNRRLVAFVHGDPSPVKHNSFLRPAGSFNHKPPVFGTGPAAPVVIDFLGEGTGWTLDDLDRMLPSARSSVSSVMGAGWKPAALPGHIPSGLADILADVAGAELDRSARLFQLVKAARRAGLSDNQVLAAAQAHAPSVAKYGRRLDAETARVIAKLRDPRRTP
jgi:hypothetical protein